MMNWTRLVEYSESEVKRGALLRFAAGQPFEDHVVMMVCEAPDKSGRLGLMAISGYKAGINCYVVFPEEAAPYQLLTKWLIDNWQKWVWPGGDVNEVMVRDPFEAQEIT